MLALSTFTEFNSLILSLQCADRHRHLYLILSCCILCLRLFLRVRVTQRGCNILYSWVLCYLYLVLNSQVCSGNRKLKPVCVLKAL